MTFWIATNIFGTGFISMAVAICFAMSAPKSVINAKWAERVFSVLLVGGCSAALFGLLCALWTRS